MSITLNSLSAKLLTSILLSSFSEVLFYSFTWKLCLCLLTLPNSLCLFLCVGISAVLHRLEKVASWRGPYEVRWHKPSWSLDLGVPGMPPLWAACALLGCGWEIIGGMQEGWVGPGPASCMAKL